MEPIIKVENLTYAYPTSKDFVLKNISFTVNKGEVLAVIGPNGAGKSTLLKALNGLVPHFYGGKYGGKVIVSGFEVLNTPISKMSTKVGFVFQDPEDQISGLALTVWEEVAFGLMMLGYPREEIEKRVKEAIDYVGLTGLEKRSPFELSGGQMQRLAIATVLALRPEVIVMDEPTAQLDPLGKYEVLSVIEKLAESGSTIVLAEHEIEEVVYFADKMLLLDKGEAVAYGDTRKVVTMVEELKRRGVDPPSVTELTSLLKEKTGVDVALPVTLEEAVKLYSELLR
ncbi:MAG: ABC transporter ATP-binding protein [Thermofilum sp.]|uniref:energy-coupling factor ABC transporter ATP-binding protein n=1 Tax=Thermofilum sp. TaxID=1961369 RepID=UPI00258302EB|nr:ABC transporter ATP-binding protein [Thermofilum sp.]MCI4409754.1 ABC transporter ATP-binding protein [Thermofilum sp.]